MRHEQVAEKLVYNLDEVSRLTGLKPGIIESWEKEFPFLHAGQTSKGQKIFRRKDLEIILRIKDLIEKKCLTLAGAKRKIEEEFRGRETAPVHPDRLKKVLHAIKIQLEEIVADLEKESKKI